MAKRYSYHGVGEQHSVGLGWWLILIGAVLLWVLK